ncbi:DNA-binding transcriptional regulator, MerR family [Duganella sp. CF402]|uniref:helix-turn-helix domain-containing protein n=1 Tax=unclassified Duganella TaxID=2636909 RepID=UPI0008C2DD97|nr:MULTISPECIES: MerR family transcriptional regulator [unclassified Duganella]RZT10850.1 MerR family transcriptional regulator [Duganella sp. BK701]SEK93735.1 DNA-binding transcriptional regulator, MerR family [Duganella sp. CF402]
MLISEFASHTGLPVDTVRFYISKGLLHPTRGTTGGSRSYQIFSAEDVTAARMIRLQQSLGYSLREIAALNAEYRHGKRSMARTIQVLRKQIATLEEKQQSVAVALTFLKEKLSWVEAGSPGEAPNVDDYYC